jgi:hypothetical protein
MGFQDQEPRPLHHLLTSAECFRADRLPLLQCEHVVAGMKTGIPWQVKGVRPEARDTAREAARRSGLSVGEWLNNVIIDQASQDDEPDRYDDDERGFAGRDDHLTVVNGRLESLSRQLDGIARASTSGRSSRSDARWTCASGRGSL